MVFRMDKIQNGLNVLVSFFPNQSLPSVFCPKAARIARLMSEYKFSWPARYVRVHLRKNHMISELTSGLNKLLKPAPTARLSI